MLVSAKKTLIPVPTASVHASTVCLEGDDILLAWFGGSSEGDPDVDIYMTRRTNGAWSFPQVIAGQENLPHWNPVLFRQEQSIDLFYKVGCPIPSWYTRRIRSEDGGQTWTAPAELVPGDIGGRGPVRNKPIRLASGRILAPASIETQTHWDAFVDISDDGARTFRASAWVPLWRKGEPKPEGCLHEPWEVESKGVIQPTLWQTPDGVVHMLLRSTEGLILRSDSTDEGETWCPAYSTGMPNNNSGIDLIQMEDGRICLVMNPVGNSPGRIKGLRSPISVYVSCDGGDTFREMMHLELNPGEYSYPAIVSQGNKLYISYTWKRVKIAFWELELEPVSSL